MTFREILKLGLAYLQDTQGYEKLGIEVVENSPKEIADVAIEMDEINRGTWTATEEDEKLQECFWSILKANNPQREIRTRIGREFLRQHHELLT